MERVTQFIETCSMDTKTALVDGRTIDFSKGMIARHLRLPKDGAFVGKKNFRVNQEAT